MNIPIITMDEAFHIGTLNIADRGSRMRESQEGHLLSVSNCPEAWQSIVKLGGHDLHSLTDRQPLKFLDIVAAKADKELRNLIRNWGIAEGLAEDKELWLLWDTDEDGEWRYSAFATEDEAKNEVDWEFLDEESLAGPNGLGNIESRATLTGTEKLALIVQNDGVKSHDAFGFLALVWAESTLPHLHGVWWDELHDPIRLSAPRGGVFAHQLDNLRAVTISFDDLEHEIYPVKFELDNIDLANVQPASPKRMNLGRP